MVLSPLAHKFSNAFLLTLKAMDLTEVIDILAAPAHQHKPLNVEIRKTTGAVKSISDSNLGKRATLVMFRKYALAEEMDTDKDVHAQPDVHAVIQACILAKNTPDVCMRQPVLSLCVFTCQASSYSILFTQSVTAAFTPARTTLGTNSTSCMCVGIWACACACSPARQARTTGSVSGHGDHRRPAGVLFLVKVIQCCNLV